MDTEQNEDFAALRALLDENIAVTRENNRLLRLMRRDALIGFFVKLLIWLVVLGVPIFFISAYLLPIFDSLSAITQPGSLPNGVFGFPGSDEIQYLIEQYQALRGDTGN